MQNKNTKIYVLLTVASVLLLTACAGNPPAWWDPSGVYGTTKETPKTVSPAQQPITKSEPVEIPTEEKLEASVEEEYEELKLSPLSPASAEQTEAQNSSVTTEK